MLSRKGINLYSTLPYMLGLMSILILFLGFYKNLWQVVDQQAFTGFQRDAENRIYGRIIESRDKGMFSDGALLAGR